MKKNSDGLFVSIKLAEFKDPVAIDSWSVKRIEMEPFTKIDGYNSDDLITDAVIYAKSGNQLIWIKPYKKAPLREAKKAYKNHQFQEISVYRKKCDGVIISEAVDVRIYIRMRDMNGQFVLRKFFGITGFDEGSSVLLNDYLLGYNSFPCRGKTALEVKEAIHHNFEIRKEDIDVQMI